MTVFWRNRAGVGVPFFLCFFLTAAVSADAAKTPAEWLTAASDATSGVRQREYAAKRIMMLAEESASILIAAVRDEASDSGLRRQVAAKILGEMDVPQAEATLLEAAFGKEPFLAEAAGTALARLYSRLSDGDIYSLLKKGMRDRNAIPGGFQQGREDWLHLSLRHAEVQGRFKALVMRGLAMKYAGRNVALPEPLTWCVWEALLDPDKDLRLAAISVVPRIASSLATEKLAAFLYMENEPKLLIAALRAMAEMRPPDYEQAVHRHAAHGDPLVALEAVNALAAMGYSGMFPGVPGQRSVADFISHPSTPVRRRAIEILASGKNPAGIEYLDAALYDRVAFNRAAAAKALGEMGFAGAVGSLTPLLRDGRPDVRREAAVALSRLGVVGIVAAMLDDLRDGSMPFRTAAAEALGRIGDPGAVSELLRAVSGTDRELACVAAEALGRIGDRSCAGGLYGVLHAGDGVVADAVRKALAAIFTDDPGETETERDAWAKRHGIE